MAEHSDAGAKRRALLDAAAQASASEDLRSVYEPAFERWSRLSRGGIADRSTQLATVTRLAIGLGMASVLEAGLRLHPTYGVPILPGSALKGLAAHYCSDAWGQGGADNTPFQRKGAHHTLLFGDTNDGGVITFHDAWITPASLREGALRLDVMTPHHPAWQNKGAAPPTDFDSPIPVSFLSVSGTFDVRLSWSGPAEVERERAEAWTDLAMALLLEALDEWGIGGKTSSGYGRLIPPDAMKRRTTPLLLPPTPPPTSGTRITARLLEERTKKGGWLALHEASGVTGSITNTGDVPADKKAGDDLELVFTGSAFRYSPPGTPPKGPSANSSGGRSGDPRRGGRRNGS